MSDENSDNINDESTSLHDAISEAFDDYEKANERTIPDRDERGRFKASNQEEASDTDNTEESVDYDDTDDDETETDEEEASSDEKRADEDEDTADEASDDDEEDDDDIDNERIDLPSSWKANYAEDWKKLDPKIQKQIVKREDDFLKGISQYSDELKQYQRLGQAISPYMARINQLGMDAPTAINGLLNADYTLAMTSDPTQKQHLFVKLAKQYGVPLDDLPVEEDNAYTKLSQGYVSQQQQIAQLQEQIAQQAQQADPVKYQVEAFRQKVGKEAFDEVRDTMAGLANAHPDWQLEDLYKKARLIVRPDDIDRQVEDKLKRKQQSNNARAAKAKSASVSVKGSPSRAKVAKKPASDDLKSLLEFGFDQAGL